MGENYISDTISRAAVNTYFKNNLKLDNEIHAIEIYENNELMLRYAPHPYSCDTKCEVYSLSKSFTSTAIGIAVRDGLVSAQEKVVDIFPEKLPENANEYLRSMRVSHLLSMNTGHAEDTMPFICNSEDGVAAFLEREVQFEPGTHFVYNSGASFMLSAIISKRTGMSILDYLAVELFSHLDIHDVQWRKCGGDVCQGGTGITVSCDDIAKLGLLYLNKGVWNGVPILSSEWVEEATAFHSDNSTNGTPDWQSGYGYQFWLNAHEGFRGDGAYGQLCVVLPKHNMVVAVQAETDMMQGEMDCVFDLVENLHNNALPVSSAFTAYKPLTPTQEKAPMESQLFVCDKNPFGFTGFAITLKEDLCLQLQNGVQMQEIVAGNGTWKISEISAKSLKPKLINIMRTGDEEKIRMAACYSIHGDTIEILCRHLNTPHKGKILIKKIAAGAEIDFEFPFDLLKQESKRLLGTKLTGHK